ncbi:MAG TPA: peptide chain release factor N(5)-glutamine methyltransferase [Chromatiaceae bacterium]|nr:peptide chain release factor N(5)-glutamine methyltransferase [Chromatiaceae bacterium]
MRVDEALRAAREQLRQAGIDDAARLEAEVLLCDILGRERSWLYAWPEACLDADQRRRYRTALEQRVAGTPLAYLTGRREFWSLSLGVTPATLIPRAETELLVEQALRLIRDLTAPRVLELGTGSGCIACALASERPDAVILASDISHAALAVAERNIRDHQLDNIALSRGDWFEGIEQRFDLILSNPPYIPSGDPHLRRGDLPAEPDLALASGASGLDAITHIVEHAPAFLHATGWLLFEHGYDQGEAARALLRRQGYRQIASKRDLAGNERVSLGGCPESPAAHPTAPARR